MHEQKATNIYWHDGAITRSDRERLNGHRGFTIWFTGLSGSGKSTLAVAMEKALYERGYHTYILVGTMSAMVLTKTWAFLLKTVWRIYEESVRAQISSATAVSST